MAGADDGHGRRSRRAHWMVGAIVVKHSIVPLVAAVILALLTAPGIAEAQQTAKVQRVGYLRLGHPGPDPLVTAFEEALRKRGWVTGENVIIDYRYAEERYERLPTLATELVRLQPQVIVAVTTAGTLAAKDATSTVPIVTMGVADPVGQGLVASLARPAGNVTGFTDMPVETYAKQLQLLKDAIPRARRIALLTNPANAAWTSVGKAVVDAAPKLGIELQVLTARTPEEIEPAFRAMARGKVDALLVVDDATFFRQFGRLADLSIRYRLPSMCGNWNFANAGGLMNYSVNRIETVRQVAGYVDRILRGAVPAELPVEQPTRFSLVVNRKTAKALGVTIPSPLLLQADQIIE
jgi:putative ABC transport system substrate-binding protein